MERASPYSLVSTGLLPASNRVAVPLTTPIGPLPSKLSVTGPKLARPLASVVTVMLDVATRSPSAKAKKPNAARETSSAA